MSDRCETLEQIFSRKIAYTTASPFHRWLHTPHNQRFLPKPWKVAKGEFIIDDIWSVRISGQIEEPGPFAVEEIKSFFLDTGGIRLKDRTADPVIVLKVEGRAKNRIEADSYCLRVADRCIEITSPTWRGVLYGVYYLEQILLDRGMPALKPMCVTRRPNFDVRMFGDVYATFTVSGLQIERPVDLNTFSALSRFGANATFTFVNLGDYLGSGVYPELANPKLEQNFDKLSRLARLARSVGVDLYLNAYNLKLRSNHPFFSAHPDAKGATQHARLGGNIRCLCTSDPATLKFIADVWANVFYRVPELGGMLAIIGGEGFYHCYMAGNPKNLDCPRCSRRSPEDVVADMTNAVFRAIRKVKPDAEFFAWPYSAFRWSNDPFQLDLIRKLDQRIHIVAEIDKDHMYQKEGYVKNIWDYSIDFRGPSDRYREMTAAARKHGSKVACKTETSVTIEFFNVPYIPCLQRWGKRMEIIKSLKPDSICYAYDIMGFTRSRSEELAYRLSWNPAGIPEEEILKIAERDFGSETIDGVIKAWNLFSQAIGHYPILTHAYYRGPSFIGPAQPLMLIEEKLPQELFGRLLYLAETDEFGDASNASVLQPVYIPDINLSSAEIADMDRAVLLWEEGVRRFKSVQDLVTAVRAPEFQKELNLASYLLHVFRTIANANHFFSLRREYFILAKSSRVPGSSAKAVTLLREMERIADAELHNAEQALVIVEQDPRFDLAVRLDIDYASLVDMIKAKIRYQKTEVKQQFADAFASL